MKLRSYIAPTGLVYLAGLFAPLDVSAAPPKEETEDGFPVEEDVEEDEEGEDPDVAGVEGTVMQAGPEEEGDAEEQGGDEDEQPEEDGDWSFEVEDISDDEEALEADLKEGQVQATGKVGTLKGVVLDTNNEPIAGAYIEVVGKKYVGRSGMDGSFELALPPGTHTIVVREELHSAIEQPGIEITVGEVNEQEFKLKPQAQALVVDVTADANVEGDAGVIKKRQQSVASSDSMSREEISRSGGGNLANVARFIVGATVVDGRFVFVRGLGHRYGNTLLDGARVPSPEPDLRTVPLDIFPSGALAAVNVQKSFTPDVPGDFAGGSIQLVTREIPREPTLQLKVGLGANTATTFRPMLTNGAFATADFFAFGNLPRGLSDEIPKDHKASQELDLETFQDKYTEEEIERWGESMYTDTRVRRAPRAPINGKFGATFGDSWDLGKAGRFGILASANYSNKHQTIRERIKLFNGPAGDPTAQQVDLSSMKTTYGTRWSALGLMRWDVSENHRLEYSALYSRDSEDETREQRGLAVAVSADPEQPLMQTRLRYVMRSILYNRLGGRHRFPVSNGKHKIQLDYFGSYSLARRDDPAMRTMLYTGLECDELRDLEQACDGDIDVSSGGSKTGDQLFMKLRDDNVDGSLNLEIPFDQWSGLRTALKFGGWAEGKWRDFQVRRFEYRVQAGQAPPGTGNVINDNTIGGKLGDPDEPFEIRELTRPADNYRAQQDLYAGYAMLTLPLAKWVRLSGGARVEASNINVQPYDVFADPDAEPADCETDNDAPECLGANLDMFNVLPSVALIFSPKLPEKYGTMNIRLMGSQTVARPEFRELAPFQFTDFVGGYTVQGNADLQPTTIWNAEVRAEWFPKPTEVVAVTAFFKQFDDPIEQIISPPPFIQSFTNADGARNIGAELELRKGLGFLAPKQSAARDVLKQFALGSNFAYVYSRVQLRPPCYLPGQMPPNPDEVPNADEYEEREDCKPELDAVTTRVRPLQGQSPYVFNVFADYDNKNSGTFVRVLFNTFGERIFAVGTVKLPNITELPVPGLDLIFSQRLFAIKRSRDGNMRHELRLDFDATNLLNPWVVREQGGPEAETYRARKGISFSAGLSWKL